MSTRRVPILIPAEMVIAPAPAPEPVPVPEAEPLTPPAILTQADVVLTQPLPSVPTAPLMPAKVEPITTPESHRKSPPQARRTAAKTLTSSETSPTNGSTPARPSTGSRDENLREA
jgi:hypothetical protein